MLTGPSPEEEATLRAAAITEFRLSPILPQVNVDNWSLLNPCTVLHLLTATSEDQTALMQLLTLEIPLEEAVDIWDAWAASFGEQERQKESGYNTRRTGLRGCAAGPAFSRV